MASFSKKLCKAVEKRKVLYDRTIQQRVKRSNIESAWESVAEECNESVQSVKTRWRNIRKVLLRSVSKPNATQMRNTRSRDYYLYDELQFLLPHLANGPTDDYADSDMEFGVNSGFENTQMSIKDHTEDSNDCLSTQSASDGSKSGSGTIVEKRKRESRSGEITPSKSLNTFSTDLTSNERNERTESIKPIENYVISESAEEGSGVRFRRVQISLQRQQLTGKQHLIPKEEEDPLQMKVEDSEKSSSTSKLRTRSKSLFSESPLYDEGSDSDADCNPPPIKRTTVSKETPPVALSTIVTRKKAANFTKRSLDAKPDVRTATHVRSPQIVVGKRKSGSRNESASSVNDDNHEEDCAGIDMKLLAAAAEAEAAAAADNNMDTKTTVHVICDPVTTDTGVQCDMNADEEDEEFLQRMRKWLQVMTQRQKILFRRGTYQAYIDVYDDPREFPPQMGADKYATTPPGVPAIFSGMTPVELRLVRHLAMAVSGHKITASSSPYANFDNKAQSSSARPVSNDHNIKLPTMPSSTVTSGTRTPPEKTAGNIGVGGAGGSGSGVVRTTAIALTNHNGRSSGGSMPRILRKVVRVGNNTNNNNGGNNTSNVVQSTNNLVQRNPGLVRSRVVSNNANGTGASNTEKQRLYRILPNGLVARQNSGQGTVNVTNNPNNANSPTSFSQGFAMLCNSNNLPRTPGKHITQYRQILPKMVSGAAASMGTSTSTNSNANGEQKLTGISIRRHVAGPSGTEVRTQMARRYSVCGSALNDAHVTSNKDDDSGVVRRSLGGGIQMVPVGSIGDQTKVTTRVRYTQNSPNATIRSGMVTQKFAVPSPVSNQTGQVNKSPNNIMSGPLAGVPLNEPIPVAMTAWHTTQNNKTQHQKDEEQQQMKLMHEMSMAAENAEQDQIPNEEQSNDEDGNVLMSVASKQNCIIASDAFESFVIKNEPLDLEDEQ